MKGLRGVRVQPLYNPRAAKAFAALRRMEPALAKVNGTTYPTAQGMIDEAFAKEEVWITASYQVRTAGRLAQCRACHTPVPPHGLETHSRCQVVAAITHATVSVRGSSTLGEVPALGSDHWDRLHCQSARPRRRRADSAIRPDSPCQECARHAVLIAAAQCARNAVRSRSPGGKSPLASGRTERARSRLARLGHSVSSSPLPLKAAHCVSRHELPFQVA